MSQNETIEFACPSCNTTLKVPAELAGVTGPCPHCAVSITAPYPAAQQVSAPQQIESQYQPPATAVTQTVGASQGGEIPTERSPGIPPHAQVVDSPSQPTPVRAAAPSISSAPVRPATKRRKIWPTILFPALFLLLAAAVVYLILDLMGILDFENKSKKANPQPPSTITSFDPKVSTPPDLGPAPEPVEDPTPEPVLLNPVEPELPVTPQPLEHDPQDVNKPGEVSTELPDLAIAKDSVKKRTEAIKQAQEVLKKFLTAQTFEERKPLITKSEQSDKILAATSLGKPFPRSREPGIATVREREADRSFEVFFSVAFEQSDKNRDKIIFIRTITYSEKESPKIHVDPFLDLYEERIREFDASKQDGTGTFSSLVEISAYCFDDIPRASTMAKVTFFTNSFGTEKPIATAYLGKESAPFKKLTELATASKRIPATVSVTWDTETDPEKPYLQVIRVEETNWSL